MLYLSTLNGPHITIKLLTATALLSLATAGHACLADDELPPGYRSVDEILGRHRAGRRQGTTVPDLPLGKGDRFRGGRIAPKGYSTRAIGGEPVDSESIFNLDEIKTATEGLVREFGGELFDTPEKTVEGRTVLGLRVPPRRGAGPADYTVYFTAGIHSRQRGGPDTILYILSDLLWANQLGTGLAYCTVNCTNADVKAALTTDIVVLPATNPDGSA